MNPRVSVTILAFGAVVTCQTAGAAEAPANQRAFCTAVESARSAYSKASVDANQLRVTRAKATVVQERRQAIEPILAAGTIEGWTGILREVKQLPSGSAYVRIDLPCGAGFATIDRSAVPASSTIFKALVTLESGTPIEFSAELVPHPSRPAEFYEMSFTERGAITEPNFAIALKDIKALR